MSVFAVILIAGGCETTRFYHFATEKPSFMALCRLTQRCNLILLNRNPRIFTPYYIIARPGGCGSPQATMIRPAASAQSPTKYILSPCDLSGYWIRAAPLSFHQKEETLHISFLPALSHSLSSTALLPYFSLRLQCFVPARDMVLASPSPRMREKSPSI